MGCSASLAANPSPFEAKYALDKQLGSGLTAFVYEGRKIAKDDDIPAKVAVKVIAAASAEDTLVAVRREVMLVGRLQHTNISRLYESFEERGNIYIVMESLHGGELFDHIAERGALTEAHCVQVMKDLCSALVFLHERRIVHRDIKPENLLFAQPPSGEGELSTLKLIDFGFAREVPTAPLEAMWTLCGTVGYAAPEVIAKRGYHSELCDMWSAGVLLYECITGKEAFPLAEDVNLADYFASLPRLDFSHSVFSKVSPLVVELINGLVVQGAGSRLSAAKVLQHPWISPVEPALRASQRATELDETVKLLRSDSPSMRRNLSRSPIVSPMPLRGSSGSLRRMPGRWSSPASSPNMFRRSGSEPQQPSKLRTVHTAKDLVKPSPLATSDSSKNACHSD